MLYPARGEQMGDFVVRMFAPFEANRDLAMQQMLRPPVGRRDLSQRSRNPCP
jgi:hypothetical protein